MYPGEDGKQRFLTDVRRLLGLSDTALINVNFECAAPPVLASATDAPSGGDRSADDALSCGYGSQLSLKGLEMWDAAVFCATMAAAQKAATADGTTMAVRGGDGQQQQQMLLQQQQQSQQLQSVVATSAASETELLYWTRLGSTPLPSPRQQQQAMTGALLAHHLSGPRLLLSPRQSMLSQRLPVLSPRQPPMRQPVPSPRQPPVRQPALSPRHPVRQPALSLMQPIPMAAITGEDPGGPTALPITSTSAPASAFVSSPQSHPGDSRHSSTAEVIPSSPPSVLPPLMRPASSSSQQTAAAASASGAVVPDRPAEAPSTERMPPLLLRRSDKSDHPRPLIRQRLAQVWKDILPRCH